VKFLGFDPGSELRIDGVPQHAEAAISRMDDDRYVLVFIDDEGCEIVSAFLRADFLDAVVAAARTREAAA
jgi:hypothetical protein